MDSPDEQRAAGICSLFAQLIRDMLAGTIDDIADAEVQYLSERREQGFAEVRTKLVGPKIDTLIDFRLADKLGQWSVYDVGRCGPRQ